MQKFNCFEFQCLPHLGGGKLKIPMPWVGVTVEEFREMMATAEGYIEPRLTEEERKAKALEESKIAAEKRKAWELAKFEKAEKITPVEYQGACFYSESYGSNEGYFHDIEELTEWCEGEEIESPNYVWTCKEYSPSTYSAEDIFEQLTEDCENSVEPAKGSIEALQEALDEFYKANKIELLEPDYSTAILLENRKST